MNKYTFYKILVGANIFAFIKAGKDKFMILSDDILSRHDGQLSIENQNEKPILRARVNGAPIEWYELWSTVTENEWEEKLAAFCRE